MNAPLIVTGMHRSGTSLVASLLPHMGIKLGPLFIPADFRNPRGYYEDVDFVRLQQAMIQHCLPSADRGCPDWGWTESETFHDEHLDSFHAQAAALLKSRAQTGEMWGWKDPRTTLFLDFWARASREVLQAEARYLLLYRFPWEVADSVQRLADAAFLKHPSYGYHIWLFYNRRLLAFYRQHREHCLLLSTNVFLPAVESLPTLLQQKFGMPLRQPLPDLHTMIAPALFVSPQAREAQVALVKQLYPATLELLHELDQAADLSSAGHWPATATWPAAGLPAASAELYLQQLMTAHREQSILRQEVMTLQQRVQTLQAQSKMGARWRRRAQRAKSALASFLRKRLQQGKAKVQFALEPALVPRTAAINQRIAHLLQERQWPAATLNCNIAKHDLMYRYAVQQKGNAVDAYGNYLRIGLNAVELINDLLEKEGRKLANLTALLDFASGYGRVTRFLVQVLPPERIWVAEIKAAALHFQQQQFGVHGLLSSVEPATFTPAQRFDCIFVGSLFSHLPAPLFHGWLQQLYRLLLPGGLLIFTVHDHALRPTVGVTPLRLGELIFTPYSEERLLAASQAPLPTASYGLAYVDEIFVQHAIGHLLPAPLPYQRRPGAWSGQDVYTICKTQ